MKKAIAIVLSLMLAFALCACNGSESSNDESSKAESNKAEDFIGKWVMESFDSSNQMPDGAEFEVTMEITADRFTYHEKDTIEGRNSEFKIEGVFTMNGNTAKFSPEQSVGNFSIGSKKSLIDSHTDFTGTLENEKLTLNIESNGVKTVIVMKRA